MKKMKIVIMALLAMVLLINPFDVEAASTSAPKIVSFTRTTDTIEAYEEAVYTVEFANLKSGIARFNLQYYLTLGEDEEGKWGYSSDFGYDVEMESVPEELISITDNKIMFSLEANSEGTYILDSLIVHDKKGNYVEYLYDDDSGTWTRYDSNKKTYKHDFGKMGTWEVLPTAKPVAAHMVDLQKIEIDSSVNKDSVQAPNQLTLNLTIAAPENVAIDGIEYGFRELKWGNCFDYYEELSEPWKPGLDGKEYSLNFELNGYSPTGTYYPAYISFHYGEESTWYRVEDGEIVGAATDTCRETGAPYNGEADFTVVSNMGKDKEGPELLYIERTEKGPFVETDTITYRLGVSDAKAGVRAIKAVFKSGKYNEEYFEYYTDIKESSNTTEFLISSPARKAGKYRLESLELIDMVGNCIDYVWDEEEERYYYRNWTNSSGDYVDLEGDLTYTVAKPHECKWNTGKVTVPASFDDDGVRVRTCTTCGATKEEAVAKVSSIRLSTELYTYNGKTKKPTVTLKDENGKKLSSSSYTVSYAKGRKLPGMYKVTVTLKGNYRGVKPLTFIIQPKAPTSLKATLTDANAVKLTWKGATGANGYHVYYRAAGEEEYTQVGGDVIGTEKEITGLEYGVKYEFKVASDMFFGDDCCESTKYATTSTYTLKKVEDVKVERYSSSKVKVSWRNISGESGYIITYTDADGNEKTKTYKTTSGKSTTITVPANEAVEYKVAAYKEITSKKKVLGEPSDSVTFTLRNVKAVKDAKAVLDGVYNKVKVTWSEAGGATGYNVFVKKDKDDYVELGYTTETELSLDAILEDGAKYTFKVEPVYKEGEDIIAKGEYDTAVVYVLKAPTSFKVAKSSSKVKVSWKSVSGKSGYEILQYPTELGKDSEEAKIYTTTSTSKTISASKGVTYSYEVRAYKTISGEKIYGPSTEVKEYTRK